MKISKNCKRILLALFCAFGLYSLSRCRDYYLRRGSCKLTEKVQLIRREAVGNRRFEDYFGLENQSYRLSQLNDGLLVETRDGGLIRKISNDELEEFMKSCKEN